MAQDARITGAERCRLVRLQGGAHFEPPFRDFVERQFALVEGA